jgi:hypothetical protein
VTGSMSLSRSRMRRTLRKLCKCKFNECHTTTHGQPRSRTAYCGTGQYTATTTTKNARHHGRQLYSTRVIAMRLRTWNATSPVLTKIRVFNLAVISVDSGWTRLSTIEESWITHENGHNVAHLRQELSAVEVADTDWPLN